jgi:hypothetical protein
LLTEVDKNYYSWVMEQFMDSVRAYATQFGVMPTTVVQRAKCGGGSTWAAWETRASTQTHKTTDRLKAYMKANPPPAAALAEDVA